MNFYSSRVCFQIERLYYFLLGKSTRNIFPPKLTKNKLWSRRNINLQVEVLREFYNHGSAVTVCNFVHLKGTALLEASV